MEKLSIVKAYNAIKVTDHSKEGGLSFNVSSFQGGKSYDVIINNSDANFPRCDCNDWKRNMMPCKHIIAIFTHAENVNWDSLPER